MTEFELVIEYADEETAKAVFESVRPDNVGHVDSELDGRTLRFMARSDNAGTLKNTVDDLLVCIKLAEETLGLIPGTDLDGNSFLE